MMKHVAFENRGQTGSSFIEVLISIGLVTFVFAGIGVKIKTMRASLDAGAKLMAVDAMEGSLSDFTRNYQALKYSISKNPQSPIGLCALHQGPCTDGEKVEISLYREGQAKPYTGLATVEDPSSAAHNLGTSGSVNNYYVRTFLSSHCASGSSCSEAAYLLISADIYEGESTRSLRKTVQEVEQRVADRFPALSLSCPSSDQIMYGIGLQGEALCIRNNEITITGKPEAADLTPLAVAPTDCTTMNSGPTEQYYISGIDSLGKVNCSPRFW